MLGCLSAERKRFAAGGTVLQKGACGTFALVLKGTVTGETQGLAATAEADAGTPLPADIVALSDAEVLLIDAARVFGTCMSACPYHIRLVRNFRAQVKALH